MSPVPARRVAGLRRTLIRELFESAPPDAVNLGLGQADLPVPQELRQALREAAAGPDGYGPTAGDPGLRGDVARSYPGFVDGPDHVLITAGCQEALFLALGSLLDAGDEVLVPEPGFPGAQRAAEIWGARARTYPLRPENRFHLDPDELLALISPATRAVVVISPSNPIGTVEPRETLDRLVAGSAEQGVCLLIDDTYRAYHWIGDGPAPGPPPVPAENVVACGGLSKSPGLAGWRVGWLACPDAAFVSRVAALHQTVMTCHATPLQLAARAAFAEPGLALMTRFAEPFRARRRLVQETLGIPEDGGLAPLEGAFYAWVPTTQPAARVARTMIDEDRIVVVPGEAFGRGAEHRLRVSYALPPPDLERALATIARRIAAP
ncbi:MAG: pyridoxal phosphate-dependent aminotransferase [Acidobacteriota bacterium]|nr:pyridoxal phosphate-dependent aminotransferase [Acidobacteriota bacterium]